MADIVIIYNRYLYQHTYVHNWLLGLLIYFLTPLMLCMLISYISGGTCNLTTTPNDRFFKKLFMAVLNLLPEFLPEICSEDDIVEEILFVFSLDVWPGARPLAFRLISQHTSYQTTATSWDLQLFRNSNLIYIYIYIYICVYVYICVLVTNSQNSTIKKHLNC